jgi:hypothetical protein
MNVVGNVLGSANTTTAAASQVYDGADRGVPSIFLLGLNVSIGPKRCGPI